MLSLMYYLRMKISLLFLNTRYNKKKKKKRKRERKRNLSFIRIMRHFDESTYICIVIRVRREGELKEGVVRAY